HGAVYLHHRRRGFFARQGSGFSGTRCPAAGPRVQGPAPQTRSLPQSRSRNDVAVPARRSVRDRRRRRDRSRSRPLRAFHGAARQPKNELPREHAVYIHLTLLPFIPSAGELKTKPTQHSVKELRSIGIQPDILLCRTDREIPKEERRKLGLFCNVRESAVIE